MTWQGNNQLFNHASFTLDHKHNHDDVRINMNITIIHGDGDYTQRVIHEAVGVIVIRTSSPIASGLQQRNKRRTISVG